MLIACAHFETRKAPSEVLFAAKPSDSPSALALAQEVESNHECYLFDNNSERGTKTAGEIL